MKQKREEEKKKKCIFCLINVWIYVYNVKTVNHAIYRPWIQESWRGGGNEIGIRSC